MRATNQKYAGKGGVQSSGADPVGNSVPPDPSGTELVKVDVAMLTLGKTRQLCIARAANRLKPTNYPA